MDLDDPKIYQQSLSLKTTIASIDAFPEQLEQAWRESSHIPFPQKYKKAKNSIVCGMGGSRFTPLAVKERFKGELLIPYVINDDYTLPNWVGPETLVVLSSYSGTTEEVLACYEEGKKKRVVLWTAVTANGALSEILKREKVPFYQIKPTRNPSGQPRLGVGYMTAGHIGIIYATGHLSSQAHEIEKSIKKIDKLIESYNINIQKVGNEAKQLAQLIYQRYPYLITAEFLQGFGNSFGNGLNETAKSISSPRVIPELNHHLMEGLKFPDKLRDS